MDSTKLRPASRDDLEFIFGVIKETMRGIVEELWGSWNDEWQWEHLSRKLDLPHTRIIESAGRPVGVWVVRWEPEAVYLDQIFLRPEMQNRGVGTRLIRELMEAAREQGLPLRLRVLRPNRARELYERLGFVVSAETDLRFYMEWTGTGSQESPKEEWQHGDG